MIGIIPKYPIEGKKVLDEIFVFTDRTTIICYHYLNKSLSKYLK